MIEAGTYTVWQLYRFYIRGKNPKNEDVVNYINSHVDAEFRDYAWMIAKHESWDRYTDTYYNQFNPSDRLTELPFKSGGSYYGWGIAQIDKGQSGSVTAEVYDWHRNIQSMNDKFNQALTSYNNMINFIQAAYPSVTLPNPETVVIDISGFEVSAKAWSIMIFYNGIGGCYRQTINGEKRRYPIEYDPVNNTWIFHPNDKDYVRLVIGDM